MLRQCSPEILGVYASSSRLAAVTKAQGVSCIADLSGLSEYILNPNYVSPTADVASVHPAS